MSDSNIRFGVSKTYCSVPQCKNGAWKNPELSFHKFPHVYDNWPIDRQESTQRRRKQWIRALKIGKTVTKTMVVCSSHFKASDFFPTANYLPDQKKRHLKKNAIPTLNLPLSLGTSLGSHKKKSEGKKLYALIKSFPNDKILIEKYVISMLHEGLPSSVNSRIGSHPAAENVSDTTTDTVEDTTSSATQDQQDSDGKFNRRFHPYIERISVPDHVTSPTPGEKSKPIDMDIQTPEDEDKFSLFGDFVANLLRQFPLQKALQCQCEIMKVIKCHQC